MTPKFLEGGEGRGLLRDSCCLVAKCRELGSFWGMWQSHGKASGYICPFNTFNTACCKKTALDCMHQAKGLLNHCVRNLDRNFPMSVGRAKSSWLYLALPRATMERCFLLGVQAAQIGKNHKLGSQAPWRRLLWALRLGDAGWCFPFSDQVPAL